MTAVRSFEDLIAWQKAMDLVVAVYATVATPSIARDFGLTNQMRRAAVSIPSNIAEGFDRGSRAEFHHFLSIAKGSCAEVRSHVEVCRRVGYLSDDEANILSARTIEVSRILGALRITVERQRSKKG